MSNQIEKLNTALFREMELLDSATEETMEAEIARAKSVASLASQITANHRLALEVARASQDTAECVKMPSMLSEG